MARDEKRGKRDRANRQHDGAVVGPQDPEATGPTAEELAALMPDAEFIADLEDDE